MEKIIHYCWFGGKPLPKLAKKCLRSWKKYLPGYKIMEWNENNFDVNCTEFSKKAFEDHNWAFVSDVARVYALKEYGGIYFDTDMILKSKIYDLVNCDAFAGWESDYSVAVGVLGAKKGSSLIEDLWNFYSKTDYSKEEKELLAIPNILTDILKKKYSLRQDSSTNQTLENDVVIYARDYFYPISGDDIPLMFTKNTRMIHYYIGSWTTNQNSLRIKFQTTFGVQRGNSLLNFLVASKSAMRKIGKVVLYPYVLCRRKKRNDLTYEQEKARISEEFKSIKGQDYVVFCNREWLGTSNATKELFGKVVSISELFDDRLTTFLADYISKNYKLVVFSAFAFGWSKLIEEIRKRKPEIEIKVIWHGGLAMNVEYYDWSMFEEIFKLLNSKKIDSIAFVKKSIYEFYKIKGYNVELILNTVHLPKLELEEKEPSDHLKIGLYASGDRWVKNFYNQLAAASLFENATIDCIPLKNKAKKMASIFNTSVSGVSEPISREQLLARLAKNDINFYVTFSECAPMIPLESLELGVPCITSHNHHYWEGTELEKYLVVDENDNILKIYEKAKYCLENRENVLKLYRTWKKEYDKKAQKSIEKFLNLK